MSSSGAATLEQAQDKLNELISNIERNLVSKSKAMCRMYTIHAYKGMENNNIRVFNDIDHDEEQNIRDRKKLWDNGGELSYKPDGMNKELPYENVRNKLGISWEMVEKEVG